MHDGAGQFTRKTDGRPPATRLGFREGAKVDDGCMCLVVSMAVEATQVPGPVRGLHLDTPVGQLECPQVSLDPVQS